MAYNSGKSYTVVYQGKNSITRGLEKIGKFFIPKPNHTYPPSKNRNGRPLRNPLLVID